MASINKTPAAPAVAMKSSTSAEVPATSAPPTAASLVTLTDKDLRGLVNIIRLELKSREERATASRQTLEGAMVRFTADAPKRFIGKTATVIGMGGKTRVFCKVEGWQQVSTVLISQVEKV